MPFRQSSKVASARLELARHMTWDFKSHASAITPRGQTVCGAIRTPMSDQRRHSRFQVCAVITISVHIHSWGCKNRTCECESQSLMPYRLAKPHYYFSDPSDNTTRTAMLPLGISKEKKKYEKEVRC